MFSFIKFTVYGVWKQDASIDDDTCLIKKVMQSLIGWAQTYNQPLICKYNGTYYKNIERHTADTIVSWINPKQWVIVHSSDLMMIIRKSIYIILIITKEMGKLKTYSPTYRIMDDRENMLNLTHIRQNISDSHFISSKPSDKFAQWW